MKLLVLINGWSGRIISGGDYHILRVMKEWNNSHHISLIIPLIGLLSCQPLLSDKYKIYLSSSGTGAIYSFMALPAYFIRIIRVIFLRFKDKPDVIVCSSHLLYDTVPGFILQLRFRAKLVVYVHLVIADYAKDRTGLLSRISILGEKISLRFVRRADIIFVVSDKLKETLINVGFDPEKILVSSNGLDYKAIASASPIDNIRYDGCFCGRLVKNKGIYDLVDIWKLVTMHFPNSKLVIIGDGPEFRTLSNKIKEANLDKNIQLMGYISEREKFLTMRRSKIFIYPSYEDSWGISVAEAIACGLNVFLYDIGVYNAFEGHFNKVEKANSQKMGEAIVEFMHKEMKNCIGDRQLIRLDRVLDWKDISNKEMAWIKEFTIE